MLWTGHLVGPPGPAGFPGGCVRGPRGSRSMWAGTSATSPEASLATAGTGMRTGDELRWEGGSGWCTVRLLLAGLSTAPTFSLVTNDFNKGRRTGVGWKRDGGGVQEGGEIASLCVGGGWVGVGVCARARAPLYVCVCVCV